MMSPRIWFVIQRRLAVMGSLKRNRPELVLKQPYMRRSCSKAARRRGALDRNLVVVGHVKPDAARRLRL